MQAKVFHHQGNVCKILKTTGQTTIHFEHVYDAEYDRTRELPRQVFSLRGVTKKCDYQYCVAVLFSRSTIACTLRRQHAYCSVRSILH